MTASWLAQMAWKVFVLDLVDHASTDQPGTQAFLTARRAHRAATSYALRPRRP